MSEVLRDGGKIPPAESVSSRTADAIANAGQRHTLRRQLAEMRAKHIRETHGMETPNDCDEVKAFDTLQAILDIHKADALNECPVCIATFEDGTYKYGGPKGWVAENYPCPTVEAITSALAAVAEVAREGMRG